MRTPALTALLMLTAGIHAQQPATLKLESADGKTIEAVVMSATADSVHVRRADGKGFDIPFSRLKPSSADAARKAAPAPPAPAEKPAADKTGAGTGARPLPRGEPAKPADIPEKVTVKCGDSIMVTFTETKTGLTRPVVVKDADEDVPHFSVEMKKSDRLVLATVRQTYAKTVTVKCLARNKGDTRWYPTSILPMFTKLPCGESWAADVEELVFYDFAWSDKKLDP